MCGIAGFIGQGALDPRRIERTLALMRNRGPDYSAARTFQLAEGSVSLLHSRLSIIDLDARSHQPFEARGCQLVFNGEIYNYLELRSVLEQRGYSFRTTSDTEVLLAAYLEHGERCVELFEGMWAFAIFDEARQRLLLSRDRFAEKPLYFVQTGTGFYFGSEVKFLHSLLGQNLEVNQQQLLRYLVNGYKSLYKTGDTFYREVQELPYASNLVVDPALNVAIKRYWTPRVVEKSMSREEAVTGVRERLMESLRIRLRADVPLAFCLSGGVDSGTIVSLAAKKFNCRVACYSILDPDERYDERDNIESTVRDLGCDTTKIFLAREPSFDRLKRLIAYHDAPIATITYYVHSFLSEAIARDGYRVVFSGTAADELFTGYYDHYLLHLYEVRDRAEYGDYLRDWQQHVLKFVRNPCLQDPRLYIREPNFREHLYYLNREFASYLRVPFWEEFTEEQYCPSLLKNRMLNELFHEATRVILHEDDLNSMLYSVENRSPFLDSRLFDFCFSIPSEHFIANGYAKSVLRDAMRGILNDQVRLDRQKKGFNASIESVFALKHDELRQVILDDSPIYTLVDRKKIEAVTQRETFPNSFSKFLFNFINCKLFLEAEQGRHAERG